MQRSTSDVLSAGLTEILKVWHARWGGERDLLFWTLQLQLAQSFGQADRAMRYVPGDLQEQLSRQHRTINAYYDNIRYALLDPLTQVWGTVVNALRAAADVPSVTPEQRRTFGVYTLDSLATFVRSAHQVPDVCRALREAFRPMPAPDCQALAALFHSNLDMRVEGATLVALVRMLCAEGPLTAAESEALALLRSTGLVAPAYQGMRSSG